MHCVKINETDVLEIVDKLEETHTLSTKEYCALIQNRNENVAKILAKKADSVRKKIYGRDVFTRGLIEFSNYCKNDCLYCGLRKSNLSCKRYRLSREQILECCDKGYELGFRTFVLQSGEDTWWSDNKLCELISDIKSKYHDCAITLSIGERTYESYACLRNAGADRYLLRHEAISPELYNLLHPHDMSLKNRVKCLHELRELGYAVGAGFIVQAPYQSANDLAKDLKFIEEFKPEMCGIGPFIPHHATPFKNEPAGTSELTCYLISILRLIYPSMLIPATTSLGSVDPRGRQIAISSGANVVMPNLSPLSVRKKYDIYDNKICTEDGASKCWHCLGASLSAIGYKLVVDRGDIRKENTCKKDIRKENICKEED